jgi:hypothetical protein
MRTKNNRDVHFRVKLRLPDRISKSQLRDWLRRELQSWNQTMRDDEGRHVYYDGPITVTYVPPPNASR